jgi:RND family efflux transporter MFP subunit
MSKIIRFILTVLILVFVAGGIAFYMGINPLEFIWGLHAAEEKKGTKPAQNQPAVQPAAQQASQQPAQPPAQQPSAQQASQQPAQPPAQQPAKGPDTGAPSAAKPASPAPEVEVASVKTQPIQRTVDFVGTLVAFEESTISSEVDGRVERVTVDLGDAVRKGELLVKINDEEARLAVNRASADLKQTLVKLGVDDSVKGDVDLDKTAPVKKARADMDNAELNHKRLHKLLEDKLVSQREVDDAQTKYQVAKATYDAALEDAKVLVATIDSKKVDISMKQKKVTDTNVVAPLSGEVLSKKVSVGEYVEVGTPLITLVDASVLRLRGDIPERFSTQVNEGQEVKASVDALPDETFSGKISRISPASNPETRAVTVEALIPNKEKKLKPGFFAKAAVLTRTDDKSLLVSQEALVTFAGVTKVFVIADNKAVERIVQKGLTLGTDVEILHGVNPGEVVATSGFSKLYNGISVTVKK